MLAKLAKFQLDISSFPDTLNDNILMIIQISFMAQQ